MDEAQLKEFLEILINTMQRMGSSVEGVSKKFDDIADPVERQRKIVEAFNESFDKLNRDIKKGRKSWIELGPVVKDLTEKIEDLEEEIEKATDFEEQQRLTEQKNLLETQKNHMAVRAGLAVLGKSFMQTGLAIGDVVIKGLLRSSQDLISGLQNNTSGIGIAGTLLTDALDTGQGAVSAFSQGANAVGTGLMFLGRRFVPLGIATQVATGALDYFSQVATEAAKFGISVLTKEVEKTVAAFHTATGAGALFARGMDDVRFYARRAGLTTDQFAEVLKNNSGLLAESGYTVTDATKILGNVTSRFAVQTGKSGQTLQREMMNLGIGVQEQAELTAQVVASLKRTGQGTASTNAAVAAATVEMAKNMKTVAGILGDEAKSRMDAAKKQAEQYAFQTKINEMAKRLGDPTLPKRVEMALGMMDSHTRRLAIQYVAAEGAMTDIPGLIIGGGQAAKIFGDNLQAGNTNLESLTQGVAQMGDRMQSGIDPMLTQLSRAAILIGSHADMNEAATEAYQNSFMVNTQNVQKAIGQAEAATAAQGKLHDSVMDAESAAQAMRVALQDHLGPFIVKFAQVGNALLDQLKARIDKDLATALGGTTAPGGGHTTKENVKHVFEKAVGMGVTGAGLGAMALGSAGTLALPVVGTVGGGLAGGILGGISGIAGGAISGIYDIYSGKYAEGGIATGPVSGYAAQLHGTEAVVPLPDGRSIPVEMKETKVSADLVQQVSQIKTDNGKQEKMMQDLIEEVKQGNSNTQNSLRDLIRVMKTNNNLTSGILNHSY